MVNAKLKDRIHTTIIRQRTRVRDIVEYLASAKWKWTGHICWNERQQWTIIIIII